MTLQPLWIVLALALASTALFAEPATLPSQSPASRAAAPLITFAQWCAQNKARSDGLAALNHARALAPDVADFDAIEKSLQATSDDISAGPIIAARRTATYDAAAAVLDQLTLEGPTEDLATAWQLKAIELSPRDRAAKLSDMMQKAVEADDLMLLKRIYIVAATVDESGGRAFKAGELAVRKNDLLPDAAQKVVAALIERQRTDLAGAYLVRLTKLDPIGFAGGKYDDAIKQVSKSSFLLRTKHPLVSIVAVPPTWDPTKKTAILLAFEGAGCNYQHLVDLMQKAVGDRPYVIVTPATFSNTNGIPGKKLPLFYMPEILAPYVSKEDDLKRLEFDMPGTVAALNAVCEDFNCEQQLYVFGFSGGGFGCYETMLTMPGTVIAAAPTCANFDELKPGAVKSSGAPVQQFFGGADAFSQSIEGGPGLLAQGDAAAKVLVAAGYHVLPPKVVPGVEHDPMCDLVVAFFDDVRKERDSKTGH